MSVSFSYSLVGAGWSKCSAVIGEQCATVTASYLSDALGDLVRAVIRLVEGQPEASASFEEEPGEYRWRFFRKAPDRLSVRILEFPQLWAYRPDEEGKPVLEAECRLRTFAGAILSELQRLLAEYGAAGYREKWVQHDFPREEMERLQQLLRPRAK
jgi:hypothetical protein